MSHDSSNVRARRAVPQPPAVAQSVPQRNRRSIRLQGYDYSQAGTYFVTVCTQNRECLFGEIVNGAMRLNDAGKMIQAVWDEIPAHYPGIDIDAFIIMPNHIHGIVVIVGAGTGGCPYGVVISRCGAPIQNHDHKTICRWRETMRMGAIPRQIMATQLLGTHRPQ